MECRRARMEVYGENRMGEWKKVGHGIEIERVEFEVRCGVKDNE